MISRQLVEQQKPGRSFDAIDGYQIATERDCIVQWLIGQHVRVERVLALLFAQDDFEKVSGHSHVLTSDDLIFYIQLVVGLFPDIFIFKKKRKIKKLFSTDLKI